MKKIVAELAAEPLMARREFWKKKIPITEDLEFKDFFIQPEELKKNWRVLLKDCDAAILALNYSKLLIDDMKVVPLHVREIKMMDAMLRKDGELWPANFLRESLHMLIGQRAPDLNTRNVAYITGIDSTMRTALSVVVQMGFQRVKLVAEDPEPVKALLTEFQRLYFGMTFRVMKNSDLTMQQNDGSILINTIKLDGRAELIEDLSYLNYINSDGLVVDTNNLPLSHKLSEEASNVGLKMLSGAEIRACVDWLFLKALYGDVGIKLTDYTMEWIKFMVEKNTKKKKPAAATT